LSQAGTLRWWRYGEPRLLHTLEFGGIGSRTGCRSRPDFISEYKVQLIRLDLR
jgi:hypothetical protein